MKGVIKLCVGVRLHEVCMQLGEQTGTKKLRKQVQTFYEFQLLTQVRFKFPNVQRLQDMLHRFRSCMTNNSEHFVVKNF